MDSNSDINAEALVRAALDLKKLSSKKEELENELQGDDEFRSMIKEQCELKEKLLAELPSQFIELSEKQNIRITTGKTFGTIKLEVLRSTFLEMFTIQQLSQSLLQAMVDTYNASKAEIKRSKQPIVVPLHKILVKVVESRMRQVLQRETKSMSITTSRPRDKSIQATKMDELSDELRTKLQRWVEVTRRVKIRRLTRSEKRKTVDNEIDEALENIESNVILDRLEEGVTASFSHNDDPDMEVDITKTTVERKVHVGFPALIDWLCASALEVLDHNNIDIELVPPPTTYEEDKKHVYMQHVERIISQLFSTNTFIDQWRDLSIELFIKNTQPQKTSTVVLA
jgi:hypothetical protein